MRLPRIALAVFCLAATLTAAAQQPGPYVSPKLLTHSNPIYPGKAKRNHIDGMVKLKVAVGKDGAVKNVVPIDGPDPLYEASVAAVRKWVYSPATRGGEPVDVEILVTVNFWLPPA